MKKLILFFTNPIIGGILSLIGILEIHLSYLQPVITQYFVSYKSEIWA